MQICLKNIYCFIRAKRNIVLIKLHFIIDEMEIKILELK